MGGSRSILGCSLLGQIIQACVCYWWGGVMHVLLVGGVMVGLGSGVGGCVWLREGV